MNDKSVILQIKDVGYRAGENTILQHVDFCLSPGEFKLITGPSGCGKSTLLKIVASLLSPTEGQFCLKERTSLHCRPKAIASRCHTACKPRCLAIRFTTT
jgi:putative ABC transport system ATP-binding protein